MAENESEPAMRFASRMSDTEALMWTVEKDPWLNPNGATVSLLDRPVNASEFATRLRHAVASIPRLRERVVPGFGRWSPPAWAADPEFDFDYHLRHVCLPPPGSTRQLYDLATHYYEDPFDRTRPLWQFVMIDGVEGGRGAMFLKVHHTISDGIGLIRLAQAYMEPSRRSPIPPDVDLDRVIADAVARDPTAQSLLTMATHSAGHLWRRQLGMARRAAGEAARLTVDPLHAKDLAEDLFRNRARSDCPGARRRRRHPGWIPSVADPIATPAPRVVARLAGRRQSGRQSAGRFGQRLFRGRCRAGCRRLSRPPRRRAGGPQHLLRGQHSRRRRHLRGGKLFYPTCAQVPGGPMRPEERFRAVRDRMAKQRAQLAGGGAFGGVAGLANLMPPSVVTRIARSQVTKIDFATSNMRAAPFPMYISGAEILENVTMGPVAGTAFNLTAISHNGSLDMGAFIDPVAVSDPGALRDCLAGGYAELLAAGGIVAPGRPPAR